jgi:polyamine oxidase
MESTSKKTIIIVGAGVSGLQAAYTLLNHPSANSFDITVLEARDRVGGRVCTRHDWGFPLDFGNLGEL